MSIRKLKIKNFKIFRDFEIEFNRGLNILVGQNNVGKSTIIEAVHLALTGYINGKTIYNEYTEALFNVYAVEEYITSLRSAKPKAPPEIEIEVFFDGDSCPNFMGHHNSEKNQEACGFKLSIKFDDDYLEEYEELLKGGEVPLSLPIEYYKLEWISFADEVVRCKTIKIKSILVDSTYSRYSEVSNSFITRVVKTNLEKSDVVSVSKVHRKLRENFENDNAITEINNKLNLSPNISDKNISLSIELLTNNSWDKNLMAYLDNIPFHNIGKGEQCIIKTNLALSHKKAKEASIILIEEPENHLTYANLNKLINNIANLYEDRQIIISTHSSFVANKLGLDNIIMLNKSDADIKRVKFNQLPNDTYSFFKKVAGYDTLRLILSEKVILVEGPSDELVVQKIYYQKHKKLPIEDGIDIISVGTTFVRFLDIASLLNIKISIITDSDGKIDNLNDKYKPYQSNKNIKICYDDINRTPEQSINGINYNTLENYILISNGLNVLNKLFNKEFSKECDMLKYMENNKTDWALIVFSAISDISSPDYIKDAIEHVEK